MEFFNLKKHNKHQTQKKQLIHYDQTLVLLGDSTLDNICWVSDYQSCIKAIISRMNPNLLIYNLAADGFTSKNMIHGNFPSISFFQRQQVDPFPKFDKLFKPLDELNKIEKVDFIVLSIGGNDIRITLMMDPGSIVKVTQQLLINYEKILKNILAKTKKVIIMMQYRPSILQDNYQIYQLLQMIPIPGKQSSIEKMNYIMENIYENIIKKLRIYNLPFIDLPNTFDINNINLYEKQIQPSKEGGQIIGQLIDHVMKNHDYSTTKFYLKKDENIKSYESENWKIQN